MNVPYHIVIEEQEYDNYAQFISKDKILVLDKQYQKEYDTCDDLGLTKSVGPGAARNFIWDDSIRRGFDWHWVMDDNISCFMRLNNNRKISVADGTIFKCMEDFVLRYKNVAMAGPNYDYLAKRKQFLPPYIINTRIYSCNFIRNDTPYRWRGRYNEDTDLSLRMLKDNWCTIQFNAFLQGKITTQVIKGGNTAEFYAKEGTKPKSEMQVALHPDVSELVWKFGRWHHHVDYRSFKYNNFLHDNQLIRKEDVIISQGINNYGMKLIELS